MNRTLIPSLILLVAAAGCFNETRTYSMSVKNQMSTPVSVCVTKRYGPPEQMWQSPEEMIEPPHPATDQTPPGKVIPPGKTLTAPPFTGRFDRENGRAFLRVYYGTPSLTQMNAISAGNPDRLDVPLEEGLNRIEITASDEGRMTAARIVGPWPSTQPVKP